MSTRLPRFRELTRDEIDVFLAAQHYGRLAYAFRDRVDIEPIHYVYHEGWIYGRTQPGAKLTLLQRNPWVAFEIDEVRGIFEWKSVVVKGTVYFVGDQATDRAEDLYEEVIERLRELVPETMTEADPVPDRWVLFRIFVDEARGREALP
jgi:nitroimidazol reductase NimA-like FMN-containing flavoprotein (pyridoxamine 5'-phosphate oxidase superfamily)